jgi:hypothetical protein
MVKIVRKIIYLSLPNLVCLAPWRESFPAFEYFRSPENLRKPGKLLSIVVLTFPQTALGKRDSPVGEQPVLVVSVHVNLGRLFDLCAFGLYNKHVGVSFGIVIRTRRFQISLILNVVGYARNLRLRKGRHRGVAPTDLKGEFFASFGLFAIKVSLLRALRVLRGENFFTVNPEEQGTWEIVDDSDQQKIMRKDYERSIS